MKKITFIIIMIFSIISFNTNAQYSPADLLFKELTEDDKLSRKAKLLIEISKIKESKRTRKIYIEKGRVEIGFIEVRNVKFNYQSLRKVESFLNMNDMFESLTRKEEKRIKKLLKEHYKLSPQIKIWIEMFEKDYHRMLQEKDSGV